MYVTVIGIILLILHVIICCLVYVGIRCHILKVKKHMMPMVIFIPFWGLVCCLILHFQIFIKANGEKKKGVEKLQVEDQVYRSILPDNFQDQKDIVPLEEALIMNDSKTRRDLMMDILNDHPQDYMEALLQARMNEDVEVVHYAATAMTELSKSYDTRLRQMERTYRRDPENYSVLEEYCDLLKEYLSQGLAQGQLERMQRERYSQLLEKKLAREPVLENYVRLVENEFSLKRCDRAGALLDQMEKKWEDHSDYHMLRLEYYALMGRGVDLENQIREIDKRHIYLSRAQRERINFWRQKQ
ncbi:hypothetical protein HNP82_000069 [Catenibacillus scindens]|uniref:Uncharacterized protein n=1 Tax=Catenibacillus scindens TaxID=673271 RepID=A0A7W8M3E4_9FIRM|nr:hypothetical protein [Catenibacillus scindens]MBB5262975.1 hypothetical protein [Catenibacillus scindens]